MSYEAELCSFTDYNTTNWSGGTTTEIAIAPKGSIYAERDFLWRLSSATVDVEKSDFTSLPDYNRIILTLSGDLRLSHNKGGWINLTEFTPHAFDGGDETASEGKVVDFNLMTRKGRCDGDVLPLLLEAGESIRLDTQMKRSAPDYTDVVIYCYEGRLTVALESGAEYELGARDSLKLSGSFENAFWRIKAQSKTAAVASGVCKI